MSVSSEFEHLVHSSLDLKWHMSPVDATAAGLSQFDHLLGRFTADDVRQHTAAFKAIAHALEACNTECLDDEIDRTALLNHIRAIMTKSRVLFFSANFCSILPTAFALASFCFLN